MLNVMKLKGDGDAPWKLPASSEKESHHQQLVFSTILKLFTIISVSSLRRPSGNQEALQSQSPPACSTLPPSPMIINDDIKYGLKIPLEMEVASRYTLLTLFITVQTAFHYLKSSIYAFRHIYNVS